MDERSTCERLVTYDTSTVEGIGSAAGFVKGWLEARDVEVTGTYHNGRPVLAATVGAVGGPTVVLHGHLDVVPGHPEQFEPRLDGDRLFGRGAYDMKGGLAAMMCATRDLAGQDAVRVHFVCVCDEESEEEENRGSDHLVEQGYVGDFAVTGEPTDLRIGVQAKGVLAMRIEVAGKAAHGSTPWEGDNAVLKALDTFRRIEALPFARESSDLFDRPVHQPRPHTRGRRPEQGPRRMQHRRRRALPARAKPRGDPGGRCRAPRRHSGQDLPPPARRGLARGSLRSRARRDPQPGRPRGRREHLRGAPRLLRRGFLSGRRRARDRVRARRRRSTTAPRSGCRSPRWSATATRSWSLSCWFPSG